MSADLPRLDLQECVKFAALWCKLTGALHLTLTAITPDGSTSTATFERGQGAQFRAWITEMQTGGRNVYYHPNATPANCSKKPSKNEMVAAVCRHADVDPADKNFPLAEERQRLHALNNVLISDPAIAPSVVIDSGNGLQLLYVTTREELTPEVLQRVEHENRAIEHALGALGTNDVTRLLRLPGTLNFPNREKLRRGRTVCRARLLHSSHTVFAPEQMAALGGELARRLAGSGLVRTPASKRAAGGSGQPAEAAKPPRPNHTGDFGCFGDFGALDADLEERIKDACVHDPRLRRRWEGEFSDLRDQTRSAHAMALGAALKGADFLFEDMVQALAIHPATAEWVAEKGLANKQHELKNIWKNANVPHVPTAAEAQAAFAAANGNGAAVASAVEVVTPSLAVMRLNRRTAPQFPFEFLASFWGFWGFWVYRAAEGAGAPLDYTALALLVSASSLIGNARWVMAWEGWLEPPVLWGLSVGGPGSGKSPGSDPVLSGALDPLQAELNTAFQFALQDYATAAEVASKRYSAWEAAVTKAIQDDKDPPPKPPEATQPRKPVRPRLKTNDATVEKLAELANIYPKSFLFVRDEAAGWIGNFDRYGGHGGDRAFWIEAYGGRSYTVDRKSLPEPIHVTHLAISVFGGIQPERLAETLNDSDDGLFPRFLYAWPELIAFKRPQAAADTAAATTALRRLVRLQMAQDGRPQVVPLAPDAASALERFVVEIHERGIDASGLMSGAIAKARGHVLRLSLVLEFLRWCADPSAPEPPLVSRQAVEAAVRLVNDYFLPMAERVFGDAAVGDDERRAGTLARWIVRTRPRLVNVRDIRENAHQPGLRETENIKAACNRLVEVGWLFPPPPHSGRGRPRGDYLINPLLWKELDFDVALKALGSQNPHNTQNPLAGSSFLGGADDQERPPLTDSEHLNAGAASKALKPQNPQNPQNTRERSSKAPKSTDSKRWNAGNAAARNRPVNVNPGILGNGAGRAATLAQGQRQPEEPPWDGFAAPAADGGNTAMLFEDLFPPLEGLFPPLIS